MRVRRHQNGLCAESGTEQRSAPGIWADYQAVFDGTVSTNSLDGIWEAFCRRSLGSDGQPLAISDLVELYDDSGSEFYYVDRTAIVPVQLKAPEQESGMTMTL